MAKNHHVINTITYDLDLTTYKVLLSADVLDDIAIRSDEETVVKNGRPEVERKVDTPTCPVQANTHMHLPAQCEVITFACIQTSSKDLQLKTQQCCGQISLTSR